MTEAFDSGSDFESGTGLTVESFSGVNGSSPATSASADTSTQQAAPQQTVTTQPSSPDNPAWAPFLEGVPDVFHSKLKNHLKSWDDNYRGLETKYSELEGKYKPYQAYEGVNPQALSYGLNLVRQLQENPVELHRLITDYVKQQGFLQDQKTPEQESLEMGKDPYLVQLEQRQADLDRRQQTMDQYVQEQQYNAQVDNYQKQIDTQIQELVNKYGDAVDVQDVLGRMFNQVNQGKSIDANSAFEEQKQVFQRMWSRQNQGRPAPTIIPPTGTIAPTGEKPVNNMNDEERQAHLVQMLKFVNSGG